MRKFTAILFGVMMILFLLTDSVPAKQPIVYVATLSTSYAHIGMAMPLSALFYRAAATIDTNWHYSGRPNNRIYQMDFHLPSRMIVLATHTGVHRSFDAGKSWKVVSDWRMTEVNWSLIDQQNPDIIYASSPYGFYKTSDRGQQWQKFCQGLESIESQFVSSIVIDAANPRRLLISTEDGIYFSEDQGASWTRSNLSVRHVRVIVQHPRHHQIFAAGTENDGLYFSTDGGRFWDKRDAGVKHNTMYTIAFDPNSPDTVYAGGFQTGVYKSIDGGRKWSKSFQGLDDLDIHSLAVTPGNSDLIYAGTMGNGVFVSTDAGKTWRYAGIKDGYVSAIKMIEE